MLFTTVAPAHWTNVKVGKTYAISYGGKIIAATYLGVRKQGNVILREWRKERDVENNRLTTD